MEMNYMRNQDLWIILEVTCVLILCHSRNEVVFFFWTKNEVFFKITT